MFVYYCVVRKKFLFHTILGAALQMVNDGTKDRWQVHDVSALSKTQNEQLVPAGAHQASVRFLTEKYTNM